MKHRLHHAITASSKERLQMLYWLKQDAIATRKELSQKLGRDESTIYRWLKRYRQGGLRDLLDVKTPPGKKSKISQSEMNQLKERLSQPQGFKSYGEIPDWLNQRLGVDLAYKSIHKIVRYKLKAKLTGRIITLQGIKPQGTMGWSRDNFYLYGLVEPLGGESFFGEFSHLDSLCFQHFLDLFSQTYPDSLNLIQMDNGSFHKSQDLKWADNIIPIFQPPYSPELNPIERFWEYIKSKLA